MRAKFKILISEHLYELCQICSAILGADCEAITVERCSDKVIAAIRKHLPHIVFLESDNSLCDAVEIISQVRNDKGDKLHVFMVITHSFSEECRVTAVGVDYIFLKPIDWFYMANRIQHMANWNQQLSI